VQFGWPLLSLIKAGEDVDASIPIPQVMALDSWKKSPIPNGNLIHPKPQLLYFQQTFQSPLKFNTTYILPTAS